MEENSLLTGETIITGVIVCHCYKCNVKRVFEDVDIMKPVVQPIDPNTPFGKYMDYVQKHGAHQGYILIQKISNQKDLEKIVEEIGAWR